MAFFRLNQREDYQGYGDVEGEMYNYRSNVPGHRKLSAGDRFVYYWPGEYVIFGGGTIGEIETETTSSSVNSRSSSGTAGSTRVHRP